MQRTTHPHPPLCFPSLLAFVASSLVAVTAATAQVAHGDTSALDDSGNYREEVQACREGRTAEDRATCLKEARNAAADKRRGVLANRGDFQANALARCDAHRVAIDKAACRDRVLGEGGLTGSVAGGGLLRELEVTLPQEPSARQASEGPGEAGAMGAGPQAPVTPAPSYDMPAEPGESPEASPQPLESQPLTPPEDAPQPAVQGADGTARQAACRAWTAQRGALARRPGPPALCQPGAAGGAGA